MKNGPISRIPITTIEDIEAIISPDYWYRNYIFWD